MLSGLARDSPPSSDVVLEKKDEKQPDEILDRLRNISGDPEVFPTEPQSPGIIYPPDTKPLQGPKTGTDHALMSPPHHLWDPPTELEPLIPVHPDLVETMMSRDTERLACPEAVLGRIVYDCYLPNPSNPACQRIGSDGIFPPYYIPSVEGAATLAQTELTTKPHLPNESVTQQAQRRSSSAATTALLAATASAVRAGTATLKHDFTLMFESRFESGNLRRATQVYPFEYDLIVRPDLNTRAITQWFYFCITNTRAGAAYTFNIINMTKPESMYELGMRPLLYSRHDSEEHGIGWRRIGWDVCYYRNHIRRKTGYYYTLTFTVEFPHDDDTVYIAACYPYTYTDLRNYLSALEADPRRSNRFRRRTLCQTLAGNDCDMLTVTSFAGDPEALRLRKGVFVTARVHPGESNASWMMKGLIDYLTGPALDAKILRDNFVFKIVPMLNPDGVVNGNYRCSLAGLDLNRQWHDPSRRVCPTIHHAKAMLARFVEDREVVMFVDMHGHSRKHNIFMYGCENKHNPQFRLQERVFPRILHQNARVFSFENCNFRIQKQKETSARVVVWREFRLLNSFTIEASVAGADFGPLNGFHFTTHELELMGHYLCDGVLDYCDPDQSKVESILSELQAMHPGKGLDSDEGSESDGDVPTAPPTTDDLPDFAARRPRRAAMQKPRKKPQASKHDGHDPEQLVDERGVPGIASALMAVTLDEPRSKSVIGNRPRVPRSTNASRRSTSAGPRRHWPDSDPPPFESQRIQSTASVASRRRQRAAVRLQTPTLGLPERHVDKLFGFEDAPAVGRQEPRKAKASQSISQVVFDAFDLPDVPRGRRSRRRAAD